LLEEANLRQGGQLWPNEDERQPLKSGSKSVSDGKLDKVFGAEVHDPEVKDQAVVESRKVIPP
jgi:hypothetical protein